MMRMYRNGPESKLKYTFLKLIVISCKSLKTGRTFWKTRWTADKYPQLALVGVSQAVPYLQIPAAWVAGRCGGSRLSRE